MCEVVGSEVHNKRTPRIESRPSLENEIARSEAHSSSRGLYQYAPCLSKAMIP